MNIPSRSYVFTDTITNLADNQMSTMFCEVNVHPITKTNTDSVLTPNHILVFKEGPPIPPGILNDGDFLLDHIESH